MGCVPFRNSSLGGVAELVLDGSAVEDEPYRALPLAFGPSVCLRMDNLLSKGTMETTFALTV